MNGSLTSLSAADNLIINLRLFRELQAVKTEAMSFLPLTVLAQLAKTTSENY